MLNYFRKINIFILVGMYTLLLLSCGGDGGDEPNIPPTPTIITPSNLNLSITVVGANNGQPNGDGSGIIQCSASATDAVKYGFRFGTGSEVESIIGNIDFTYTQKGINTYTVYVYAYSSTGHFISTSKVITIYVTDTFQLIWFDEFDVPGNPDTTKWNYDIGTGSNGWGNGESQYYTDRTNNVLVANGVLKIIAQKENYQGSLYTSTRLKTQGKFDFTYGKVEVRAKLPIGGGTWPAIWMLGSNISTVGWPACGEIDIMEHVGNNQGTVQSALHTPSSYGNTVNKGSQYLADVSTAFHVYAVEWDSTQMIFSVDGNVYYTYNPSTKNSSTWPFDASQFIILNVAMGGSFGGVIDSNFVQSTMEIDYVRIYQ